MFKMFLEKQHCISNTKFRLLLGQDVKIGVILSTKFTEGVMSHLKLSQCKNKCEGEPAQEI